MKKFFLYLFLSGFLISKAQDYSNINYAGDGQGYHNLDIYLPSVAKEKYPVVIYIYGSAWYSNNSKGADMTTVGAALLDAGFAVVTPNHRSSSDAKFPAQIHDIKSVIRFVRGTSSQYKFDTTFIAISGSSSGGHLATFAGATNNTNSYTSGAETMDLEGNLGIYTTFSSSVDAVVDWFGPIDFLRMEGCTTFKSGSSPEADILGGDIAQNQDKAILLSSITYVDPTDPPFLIFHGQQDNVVPSCQSQFLYDKLQDENVNSELVLVPNGQHGPGVNNVQGNLQKMTQFLTGLIGPEEPKVQSPFNSIAHAIPGKIEAEEYDLGGEGLAFHEANSNGNQGNGTFRNDEVDIEVCTDAGGGFNLGYTLTEEWVEYTVNVANTGNYDIDLRLAKDGDGGLFHIEMDEVDVTGPIEVPNTGGWQVWETVRLENLSLTSGEHIMRIVFDTDYTNLNYVQFVDLVTSTASSMKNELQVYPNPFNNEGIRINTMSEFNYRITDVSGFEVEKGSGSRSLQAGTNLNQGVYILSVETDQGISVQKITKQ